MSDPSAKPLSFGVGPLDAYSLVAALQLASRHPGLSEIQLGVVLALAHRVADALVFRARDMFGPASAVESTIAQGFDPTQDVAEEGDFDDLDDGVLPIDIGPVEDALGISERGARYVSPTWIHLPGEDDAELSKCAACARFFVSGVPIRLFQLTMKPEMALGYEICDGCAPALLGGPITRAEGT